MRVLSGVDLVGAPLWGRLLQWLLQPWAAWLTLIGLLITYTISEFLMEPAEDVFRVWGLLLQLLGLGSVAKGLSSARRLFGRPSVPKMALEWLRRFPEVIKPQPKSATGSGHVRLPPISVEGHGTVTASPDASLEYRVSVLEQEIQGIHRSLSAERKAWRGQFQELKTKLHTEASERQRGDDDLEKRLEEFSVGGLHVETMGLVWILLGILLSTAPAEVLSLF